MNVTIRNYQSEDLAACESIFRQEQSLFNQYRSCVVAVESSSQRVVGCCTFREHSTYRPTLWDIQQIAVAEDVRLQGIGRQLLEAVVERLPPGMTLLAQFTETSPDVIALFMRSGIPFAMAFASGLRRFRLHKAPAEVAGGEGSVVSEEQKPC